MMLLTRSVSASTKSFWRLNTVVERGPLLLFARLLARPSSALATRKAIASAGLALSPVADEGFSCSGPAPSRSSCSASGCEVEVEAVDEAGREEWPHDKG